MQHPRSFAKGNIERQGFSAHGTFAPLEMQTKRPARWIGSYASEYSAGWADWRIPSTTWSLLQQCQCNQDHRRHKTTPQCSSTRPLIHSQWHHVPRIWECMRPLRGCLCSRIHGWGPCIPPDCYRSRFCEARKNSTLLCWEGILNALNIDSMSVQKATDFSRSRNNTPLRLFVRSGPWYWASFRLTP